AGERATFRDRRNERRGGRVRGPRLDAPSSAASGDVSDALATAPAQAFESAAPAFGEAAAAAVAPEAPAVASFDAAVAPTFEAPTAASFERESAQELPVEAPAPSEPPTLASFQRVFPAAEPETLADVEVPADEIEAKGDE
ncbi:MAG: hypothetical protein ACREQ5_30490, partial [Candidatus Dormibacteria bacterium]